MLNIKWVKAISTINPTKETDVFHAEEEEEEDVNEEDKAISEVGIGGIKLRWLLNSFRLVLVSECRVSNPVVVFDVFCGVVLDVEVENWEKREVLVEEGLVGVIEWLLSWERKVIRVLLLTRLRFSKSELPCEEEKEEEEEWWMGW